MTNDRPRHEPTYVPLTLDSSLLEMKVQLDRLHVTPEFHRTPDPDRYPELRGTLLHSRAGWYCVLRAFPTLGARLCIGRGGTQIDALLSAVNMRARHALDLRECAHVPRTGDCDPAIVDGHCRACGRVDTSDLHWSAPGARAEVARG